jgi:vitamin B12 transporter
VTVGEGLATLEPGGFVPEGGVLRERRNLDRVEVFGVDMKLVCQFAPDWWLRGQYLYTHPTIAQAAELPQLEGKRLARASAWGDERSA